MRIFEEQEVSSGNATGLGGGASLPFNKGFYQYGNSGEPGITFSPSSEYKIKSYKNMIHSKDKLKKGKKMKKIKDFVKENIEIDNFTARYYDNYDDEEPAANEDDLNEFSPKNKKIQMYEDACVTAGNSNGMGNVVAANPSSTPGDVAGSTIGSGDIGQTLGVYTKPTLKLKKKKKSKKESRVYDFNSFINETVKKEKKVEEMSEDELKDENDKYIKLQNSFKLTPHDERRWKKISKKIHNK